MGLQLKSIVIDVEQDHAGVLPAVLVAVGALALTILIRAAYVAPLLAVLGGFFRRGTKIEPRLQDMQQKMGTPQGQQALLEELTNRRRRGASEREMKRFAVRITRLLADIDYLRREPLGQREGGVVVWAGMRGAVTVAAAQTLAEDTPQRSVLVLIAFSVAALSLLVQGGTIGPILRRMKSTVDPDAAAEQADHESFRIMELLRVNTKSVEEPVRSEGIDRREQFERATDYRLGVIKAQRSALLDARDNGAFDADVLAAVLGNLDADQISIELRAGSAA